MADYVALIGAYERDNFGDILFLHINKHLLSPWPVEPLGLVSADMTTENGGYITSASSWFDVSGDFLPRAVLFAGGEVLTCDLHSALAFTVSEEVADLYSRLRKSDKEYIAKEIGWRSTAMPYAGTSDLCNKAHLQTIAFGYNSIGGTQLRPSTEDPLLAELKTSLSRASYVSVRDHTTYAAVKECTGIAAEIYPDVVNVIAQCCDHLVTSGYANIDNEIKKLAGNYIVFQASKRHLETNSITETANQLISCASELESNVVIQAAGLAFEHDTTESLSCLKTEIERLKGRSTLQVHLQQSRDVWTQVALIARSRCFIGTSLHGRIVASSYSTPRVSLENKKVNAYAESWDGAFQPFDVKTANIAECVLNAVNTDAQLLRSHTEKMSARVLEGYKNLKLALGVFDQPRAIDEIESHLNALRTKAIYHENKVFRDSIVKLGSTLANSRKATREAEYSLNSMRSSWSWKITAPLRSAKRLAVRKPN